MSQQISSESWGFFQVQQRYRATPSLQSPVAPVALQLPGVSHVKLPLKRCRATGGCSSRTCGCRATLRVGSHHDGFPSTLSPAMAFSDPMALRFGVSKKGFHATQGKSFWDHVLTVLVFWSWVLLLPLLPPSSRSLRLFPWASILLQGPWTFAWICCLQLPTTRAKRDTQHKFLQHSGAHAELLAGTLRNTFSWTITL